MRRTGVETTLDVEVVGDWTDIAHLLRKCAVLLHVRRDAGVAVEREGAGPCLVAAARTGAGPDGVTAVGDRECDSRSARECRRAGATHRHVDACGGRHDVFAAA